MTAPKLRFKEFSGNWETSPLKALCKINQGLQIAIENRFLEDGENRFFYITNEFLKEGSKKNYFIENPPKSVICDDSDILMTRTGNTGQVVTDVRGAFHNNFFKIDFDRSIINKNFFIEFLKKDTTQHLILKYAGASTIPDLNHSDFYRIVMPITTIEEQTKIATFLSAVDEKISQLSQKLNLLGQYKQGMMHKLFSQQLRFKADDGSEFGEWGEQKLGEVSTTFSGGTPQSTNKDFYQGTIPFIKSGEISQKTTEQFINEIALKSSSAKLVQKGDLLYALYGATSGQVAISQIDGAINQAILCIRSNLNTLYLLNFFLLKKDSILSTYLQGGQGNLSAAILKEILVPIPCLEEQTKIANFLSAIDQKIDVVSEQLERAKLWKKGLLQQMFV